jgi:c-di-GMP-binding flagellar brake protein YcgR
MAGFASACNYSSSLVNKVVFTTTNKMYVWHTRILKNTIIKKPIFIAPHVSKKLRLQRQCGVRRKIPKKHNVIWLINYSNGWRSVWAKRSSRHAKKIKERLFPPREICTTHIDILEGCEQILHIHVELLKVKCLHSNVNTLWQCDQCVQQRMCETNPSINRLHHRNNG